MRKRTETAIGVDVGGTRIRVARISQDGELLERIIEPILQDREGFKAQLLRLVNHLRDSTSIAIGVGIPGRVDGASQVIKSAGYLDIAGLALPTILTRETGLPSRIENDATMALIAEHHVHQNNTSGLIMMVTVGTGIGGAVLENGQPWYGGGISGQFGHIVVAADGPVCNCGRRGCVETFSSGTALGRLITASGLAPTTQAAQLLRRSEEGCDVATSLLENWAYPLSRAIETLVAVANPQCVLIGGGLGREMALALARLPQRNKWFTIPIEAAHLGDDAGVIGAGLSGFTIASGQEGVSTE